MTVCSKRDDECGFFRPCADECPGRRCLCGEDVREAIKQQETRVARVPDSAREAS